MLWSLKEAMKLRWATLGVLWGPLLYILACHNFILFKWICNSYTMGCLPVRGDNPQALASGLS